MATASSSSNVSSLSKKLATVAKQAKSLGINTAKADSMVAQTKAQGSKAYKGSSYEKAYQAANPVITSADLAPKPQINLPTPAPVTGVPDITANNTALANPATGVTTDAKGMLTVADPNADKYAGASQIQSDFQTALQSLNDSQTTGADIQAKLEKETRLRQKQQAVNDYSAQLNTITANRDANILKLEGQGRGIPDVIIGGQQAQVNKEAAIAALPVQAQLAAAQGNLQLAQDHINTWGQILMQDATNTYNHKKELLTSIKDFATGVEFKRIDDLNAANERKYQETQAITKAKTAALSNALAQGAPASVVNAIKAATTAEDVTVAAGQYNGDILARQIQQANLSKIRQDLSGAGSDQLYGGLSSATATAVRGKVSRFSVEPVVQSFATVQEGNNFAQTIDANSKNPAEHQALIYALAKALDPGSVVREGEYATAQKYAQSWVTSYGKGVEQALAGTGFLSEGAITNIKSVINSKYNASKNSYDGLQKNYTENINALTGREDGSVFLADYTTPVQAPVQGPTNPVDVFDQVVSQPSSGNVFSKAWNWLTGK